MTITQNKVVTIDYEVREADSQELIDSSADNAPMVYLHGFQNIIPGLEQALEGKQIGDELEVTVAPAEAYGEYEDERVQQVPISAFEGVEALEPGMAFTAQTEHGSVSIIVTEVDDTTATVDANHPLAGQSLHFKVKVLEVRDASDEEIAHRHVHGEGGHHH